MPVHNLTLENQTLTHGLRMHLRPVQDFLPASWCRFVRVPPQVEKQLTLERFPHQDDSAAAPLAGGAPP